MSKRIVQVTQVIEVETNDAKFDADFMAEFTASFFPYETLDEHAAHLAQLYARGLVAGIYLSEFIEGYGPVGEMGIKFRHIDQEVEVLETSQ